MLDETMFNGPLNAPTVYDSNRTSPRNARRKGRLRLLLQIAVVFLPWKVKRWVLQRFWGYDLAPDARIGLSYIFPEHLVMEKGSVIAHLNVAVNLRRMECGPYSVIYRGNWVTGYSPSGPAFSHRLDRDPSLVLGEHSAIVKSHIIDCTDRIDIGPFSTISGYRSQFITHGIDVVENRQDCQPIRIGAYCVVGTRATVLGGAVLPDCSVLAAASVLNKFHHEENSLYAGQPAKRVKAIDPGAKYFWRTVGFVD